MKKFLIGLVLVLIVMIGVVFVGGYGIIVCLIIKIDINLFFVKMCEGVVVKVDELGINLLIFVGKVDGDYEIQVVVIEICIVEGVLGILLIVLDISLIVSLVEQVCDVGLLVIVFDIFLDLIDVVNVIFVIDNFFVGELIGQWVVVVFGDDVVNVKIVMFDFVVLQLIVGVLCD